jgi:hypothetical protein
MSVSFSTIRARFADKIKTITGFTESRNPYDDFNRNPNTVAQKRFSVGIGDVEALPEQRESVSVGVLCNTTVQIKFPYRLRPKDQIIDYGLSMDESEKIIKAITNRSAPLHTELQIFFNSLNNEITDSGEFIIQTLQFNVLHSISLS